MERTRTGTIGNSGASNGTGRGGNPRNFGPHEAARAVILPAGPVRVEVAGKVWVEENVAELLLAIESQ